MLWGQKNQGIWFDLFLGCLRWNSCEEWNLDSLTKLTRLDLLVTMGSVLMVLWPTWLLNMLRTWTISQHFPLYKRALSFIVPSSRTPTAETNKYRAISPLLLSHSLHNLPIYFTNITFKFQILTWSIRTPLARHL